MKKSLMILFCLSMTYFLMAQETGKQKEIGLIFSNLDNFGLSFKIGSAKSLWRFNTLSVSGSNSVQNSDSIVNKLINNGIGISIGKEYRKNIVENLEFRYGAELSFSYSHSESYYDDISVDNEDVFQTQKTYRPGINLVFGLNYVLNDNFLIGAELLPNFSYYTGKTAEKIYYKSNT